MASNTPPLARANSFSRGTKQFQNYLEATGLMAAVEHILLEVARRNVPPEKLFEFVFLFFFYRSIDDDVENNVVTTTTPERRKRWCDSDSKRFKTA